MDKDAATPDSFAPEVFLVASPGLEAALSDEARAAGYADAAAVKGGVLIAGGLPEAMRANLVLRGATRIVLRVARFRAMHLAQLDKRARKLPWGEWLRKDFPVMVEASCVKSKIYHAGAAAERVSRAIAEEFGAPVADTADIRVMVRIEDDLATISLDTTGESLHKRGHKEAVNRAPMRETMASLFLRQCGYSGAEPVLDPMCGSGTFVIEAAEIALGLVAGRSRSFAFEQMAGFDAAAFEKLKATLAPAPLSHGLRFFGSDRDSGAIAMSRENAERAGVGPVTDFSIADISDLTRPEGPAGLVIVNPPYGTRLGDKRALTGLYRALGEKLRAEFSGWRVGLVTTDRHLAEATGLSWLKPLPPVLHGGLRVTLWRTGPLP